MRAMAVSSGCRALDLDDFRQLALCGFEVFVNYSVFELPGMREFLACILQPAADHGFGILAARAHAPLELLDRGRQDEDADALGIEAAYLLRALPVDLQDQIVAALHRVEDPLLGPAVVGAMDFGAFEQFAPGAHLAERRLVDEVVIDAVLFA